MGYALAAIGMIVAFGLGFRCRNVVERWCPGRPGHPCGQHLLCPIHDGQEITEVQTAYPCRPRTRTAT